MEDRCQRDLDFKREVIIRVRDGRQTEKILKTKNEEEACNI